jgi:hypothetical protein
VFGGMSEKTTGEARTGSRQPLPRRSSIYRVGSAGDEVFCGQTTDRARHARARKVKARRNVTDELLRLEPETDEDLQLGRIESFEAAARIDAACPFRRGKG